MYPKNIEEHVSNKIMMYANELEKLQQQLKQFQHNCHLKNVIYCTMYYSEKCPFSKIALPEWTRFIKKCDQTYIDGIQLIFVDLFQISFYNILT
jgi:hypothetical protein